MYYRRSADDWHKRHKLTVKRKQKQTILSLFLCINRRRWTRCWLQRFCCCYCWRWLFPWCQFWTQSRWYHTGVQVYWCDYRWVISYRGARKIKNGPVMCALDMANETTSSSSQQDCSLRCRRDATCKGINIKNSLKCEVYNYKPKITSPVSACTFYQVATVSNLVF